MIIEMITAKLNAINNEDGYYHINGNIIDLTIIDFDGFDENYCEVDHEWIDEEAVDEAIEWLRANADRMVRKGCIQIFYFGNYEVRLNFTSADI